MNLSILPETHAATAAQPAARGYISRPPTDDFALMLAESAAALRPEKPASVKDAPRERESVEDVDPATAADEDQPATKPDAPREIEDDADPEAEEAADEAAHPAAPVANEAASQAILAAAAAAVTATANAAAAAATEVAENAAAEGGLQTAAIDAAAATLVTDAFAIETALQQAAVPQTADAQARASTAPAKPAATPATTPVSADAPAAELSIGSLLTTAPEPAVPKNAAGGPAPATQSAPSLIAAPRVDAKAALPAVQSPSPSPTPPDAAASQQAPASLALASTSAQETAAPGAGMIQAAVAAAVRNAAPDTPAPSASTAAADAPAALPQTGPGHAPAAPAEHVASAQSTAGPTAPTLDNVGQYVVRSVRLMVHDGQKTLTVRLIPPSLGELHLEVTSVRDSLHVRLMSSNPVVRDALERQLTTLRDTLARSGVEASSVTVSSGSTLGQASHNLFSGSHQDGAAAHSTAESDPGHNPAAGQESSRRSPAHQGLIDVFV